MLEWRSPLPLLATDAFAAVLACVNNREIIHTRSGTYVTDAVADGW